MLKLILSLAALSSAGLTVNGSLESQQGPRNAQDALGIGSEICTSKPQAATKPLIRLSAAKNELTPYGQLPGDGTSDSSAEQVPLWNNLGSVSYKIITAKPAVQRYFDQGLRLAYAFNHEEAVRSFRAAQKLDPRCTMCY